VFKEPGEEKKMKLFRFFAGELPCFVRYCEVDGAVVTRDSRMMDVHDSAVRKVAPLGGFSNGL